MSRSSTAARAGHPSTRRILGIDIGGTHLKAAIVDGSGRMLSAKVSVDTPDPCPPGTMVNALVRLVRPLGAHDHIAIGFPGVVRAGRVITAPHWKAGHWQNFELASVLARRLGSPARLINDAEMQGLAVIRGKGLELVLTLGTGAGTGLFRDGQIMPHLELAHHPLHGKKTYNDYIGESALKTVGKKRWNKRVARTIDVLFSLLHYDQLYIGGGNSARITLRLPTTVRLVSNDAGIEGGAKLWSEGQRAPL